MHSFESAGCSCEAEECGKPVASRETAAPTAWFSGHSISVKDRFDFPFNSQRCFCVSKRLIGSSEGKVSLSILFLKSKPFCSKSMIFSHITLLSKKTGCCFLRGRLPALYLVGWEKGCWKRQILRYNYDTTVNDDTNRNPQVKKYPTP